MGVKIGQVEEACLPRARVVEVCLEAAEVADQVVAEEVVDREGAAVDAVVVAAVEAAGEADELVGERWEVKGSRNAARDRDTSIVKGGKMFLSA